MASPEQPSGLNAGYVGLLLEQYLENPQAVDPAWRKLFEDADASVLSTLPGLARLVATRPGDGGNGGTAVAVAPAEAVAAPETPPAPAEPAAAPAPAAVDAELLGGIASSENSRRSPSGSVIATCRSVVGTNARRISSPMAAGRTNPRL